MDEQNTVIKKGDQITLGEKAAFTVGEIYGGGGVALLDTFFFTFAIIIFLLSAVLHNS